MRKRRVNRNKVTKRITNSMKVNVVWIMILGIVACIVVFVHIFLLMSKYSDEYKKQVLTNKSYVGSTVKYKRGNITDRNGNVLAESKRVFDLAIDPSVLSAADDDSTSTDDWKYYYGTVRALNEVFGIDEDVIKAAIDKDKKATYYLMKAYKGLSESKKEKFQKLQSEVNNKSTYKGKKYDALREEYKTQIRGVSFEERYVRTYPYSTVAADVIGYCSSDNIGSFGIEKEYNDKLNGKDGKSYKYYDSERNVVETVKEPTDGDDVVSTLDVNVQGIVEQKLAEFEDSTGADNIGCVIMNPNNGEVLAMASSPVYNLNKPADFGFDINEFLKTSEDKTDAQIAKMDESEKISAVWKNFCISNAYEPGSTFKPFTVSACLDEGSTTINRIYNCDGGQEVGGSYIKCVAHSYGGHGAINIKQALMYSCNDVLMQLGAGLGKTKFLKYVNEFGFGRKTGVDLPGEATGQIFDKTTMHEVELATSSFGQGQTVTMMQMAAGFSAVINGGSYYQPHVLKEIDSNTGAAVKTYSNTLVRQVITESTSEKIRKFLYATVEEGTALPAKVAGYKVAGKTGTAEKLPRGEGNYLVSFIGCVPADDPQLVIYVVIDQPHVDDQAHSTYATMLSSSILKDVLPLLKIYPETSATATPDASGTASGSSITLPSTKDGNLYDGAPEGGYSDKAYNVAGATASPLPSVTDILSESDLESKTEAASKEAVTE